MAKRHPGARGGDGGDAVGELVVEAAEEADDEVGVGDGSTDVAEGVGQDLELAAVLRDRHVPLVKLVELLTSLDGAIHDVVEELVGDGGPGGVGVVGRLDDSGEEVRGEHGVEPGDDASIDLRPLGVVKHQVGEPSAVDVVEDTELAERDEEEGAPCAEVGVTEIKHHGYVGLDVDQLSGGSRDRYCGSSGERVGARRARAGGHGDRRGEERIGSGRGGRISRRMVP